MATVAALAAAPATASAKPKDAVKPTKQTVQVHVTKAQKAVKRLQRAVQAGKGGVARRELKDARTQTAAAARVARTLASRATTDPQEIAATQALTLAGTQYDELIEAITALVDEITGQAQAVIAQAISPSIAGKQKIIDLLTEMVDKVPAEVQPVLASVIAGLSVGDATEVVNLDDAIDSGKLPVDIRALVNQAMQLATETIESAFGQVEDLLPMLPEQAQAPLATILDIVNSTVGTIVPSTLTTVTGLIDSVLSSMPFVGGTSATGSFGLGGLLGGIVGDGATTVPGGTAITGLLGGLLGDDSAQADDSAPAAVGVTGLPGVGGIINSVTGIINGVLGGLLGR